MSFRRWPDARCQRGLTFNYGYEGTLDREAFGRALGLEPMVATQHWGQRTVTFWTVPRRFEVRFDVRDGVVQFLHRMSASTEQRQRDRRRFEDALEAALRP